MKWFEITLVDALALSMLGVVLLSFGVILSLIYSMMRHGERRNLEVEKLLEECAREEEQLKATQTDRNKAARSPAANGEAFASDELPREPWQRPSNWWRHS